MTVTDCAREGEGEGEGERENENLHYKTCIRS